MDWLMKLFLKQVTLQVKPKIPTFEGIEDGVAFELYWAEFNHDDIVRRTVGTKTG